jgi:hypothetical protein
MMSLNFSHICRLCMEQDGTFVPLFEKGGYLLFRIKNLSPKLKVGSVFTHSTLLFNLFNFSFNLLYLYVMTYLE